MTHTEAKLEAEREEARTLYRNYVNAIQRIFGTSSLKRLELIAALRRAPPDGGGPAPAQAALPSHDYAGCGAEVEEAESQWEVRRAA